VDSINAFELKMIVIDRETNRSTDAARTKVTYSKNISDAKKRRGQESASYCTT